MKAKKLQDKIKDQLIKTSIPIEIWNSHVKSLIFIHAVEQNSIFDSNVEEKKDEATLSFFSSWHPILGKKLCIELQKADITLEDHLIDLRTYEQN